MSEAESQSSAVGESEPELQNTHEHRGLARLIIRWFVRGYYPRIEITGGDLIPQSGPILLCANHANSLLDPVVIGIVCRRPVRFMAKAPLFKHPILGPPMTALGMVPAYRGSDDTKSVRRNLESLDIGAQILIDGHAMGIFPEGKSTDQAHLEMIRSGAARMATQAVEGGAKGVMIVPVGINYQRKERFRSSIWVHVAEPIDVDAAMAAHDFEERKARRALTTELQERLKSVIIHLDEPQWESWLEDLEILVPPREKTPNTPSGILARRKRIAEAINHFLQTDRSRAESVADQIEDYRNSVHASCVESKRVDARAAFTRTPRHLAAVDGPGATGHDLPFHSVFLGAEDCRSHGPAWSKNDCHPSRDCRCPTLFTVVYRHDHWPDVLQHSGGLADIGSRSVFRSDCALLLATGRPSSSDGVAAAEDGTGPRSFE